ncbi:MAG TPA: ABC transporter substrate-binding protein [Clostridiaceae bacterium]
MRKNTLKFSIVSIIVALVLVSTTLVGCGKPKVTTLKTVRLNEVVRSVFYAPMYAAISEGFFKEEGIKIDLSTGQGADKTMQQVLSNSADIGFCGPEQVLYIYNQKRDDYPVLFAQLTQRDGSFLVSRKDEKNFTWESLRGKSILGARPGGVPEMALEYVLKNHGIIPGKDVNMITNVAYTATAGAFAAGTGDYVALFEPNASTLVKETGAYIVSSIGKSAGVIPYTCFFSTKSYMAKNADTLDKFTSAIYKGQLWINTKTNEEIANSIKSFFPGTDVTLIAQVIKNYKDIQAFSPNPTFKEADMTRLMDIIQSYKSDLLLERPAFNKVVNNTFADNAVKTVK